MLIAANTSISIIVPRWIGCLSFDFLIVLYKKYKHKTKEIDAITSRQYSGMPLTQTLYAS